MDRITTGVSALYDQNFISYSPDKETVEMPLDTNTKKYKYLDIFVQNRDTLEIGAIELDGKFYYCPERLYIELDKFALENTIKEEAIRNLEKVIHPDKVKKLYDQLKKKRRGLNKEGIEIFLNKNLLLIKDVIKESDDKKTIIREYLMALVSKKEIPLTIIKGGSSIELYTTIKRTTLDIDAHASIKSIKTIIEFLGDNQRDIYFKLDPSDEKNIKSWEEVLNPISKSKVLKFKLVPVSKGGSRKEELEGISIPISFNTNYSLEELKEMIKDYGISKRQLKHLKNASSMVFTQEMLLAEKFQSIISKPQNSKRTKDLIDLKLLWTDDVDFKRFRKWLFRKWSVGRNPKSKEEAFELIRTNKDKELTKIKDNFKDAAKMYGFDVTYQECLNIYKTLINESLK